MHEEKDVPRGHLGHKLKEMKMKRLIAAKSGSEEWRVAFNPKSTCTECTFNQNDWRMSCLPTKNVLKVLFRALFFLAFFSAEKKMGKKNWDKRTWLCYEREQEEEEEEERLHKRRRSPQREKKKKKMKNSTKKQKQRWWSTRRWWEDDVPDRSSFWSVRPTFMVECCVYKALRWGDIPQGSKDKPRKGARSGLVFFFPWKRMIKLLCHPCCVCWPRLPRQRDEKENSKPEYVWVK